MYKHCDPCTEFGICACCEKEMCLECRENINSRHLNLTKGAQEKLEEDELWGEGFCRECIFYNYDNSEVTETGEYDDDVIYDIVENRIVKYQAIGPSKVEIEKKLYIVGPKPEPDFEIIRGPFIIRLINDDK